MENFNNLTAYSSLLKLLERKYPTASLKFKPYLDDEQFDIHVNPFLSSFQLTLIYRETSVLKKEFKGTYFYKIFISDTVAIKLHRQKPYFSYYGIKSSRAAFEKGLEKCFHIIECLLTSRPLSEQIRHR